ncbi:MAG: tRNA (adenosine(37)-N6)-threonylcarbamoyltransferase complex transferase subunit TsaD [Bacteroidota bacterium]|nr:tRNA (adenosine(37)-N6)-threonylcarbamoyltransferase complex transferase subunit TsaD [Bacteroidota bacterium]
MALLPLSDYIDDNMCTILAIESSCDDTAAAVIVNRRIRSNVVSSQPIHEDFGGVVPELASRAHQTNIVPVVNAALREAGVHKSKLDAIAFSQCPGLLGSLLVGSSFAKALALGLNTKLIAVDHLHAHILSHFIDQPEPAFPFLCLLVSGGHTLIIRMESPLKYHIMGKTTDDATGEAFDKGAKMLGLPYPGGPWIDKFSKKGDPMKFDFPLPSTGGYDFSFSGLKTSLLYFLKKQDPEFIENNLSDICASYQHRIVTYLLKQVQKAAYDTGIHEIGISGGVSANSYLRQELLSFAGKEGWNAYIPSFEYCTDNAAMIAIAAHFKFEAGEFSGQDVVPYARKYE